jgi:hypothetical protein
MRNEPFLIVIYHSTLVKGAMNAARVCKLHTGVKKPPIFLFFHRPKAEQRRSRTCQMQRDRVFEALIVSFYDCKLRNEGKI